MAALEVQDRVPRLCEWGRGRGWGVGDGSGGREGLSGQEWSHIVGILWVILGTGAPNLKMK